MMFADDIVICSESKELVEEKLDICIGEEEWKSILVRRKTEYMCEN